MRKIILILLLFILNNYLFQAQIDLIYADSITYAQPTYQKNNFLFNIGYDNLVKEIYDIVNKQKIEKVLLSNKSILFTIEIDSTGLIKEIIIRELGICNKELAMEIQNLIIMMQPLNPLYLISKEKRINKIVDFYFVNFHFYDKENLKIFISTLEE
ncbi:MAG: hypothetical protein U0W24_07915 [Bacteroidales bacterium]